MKKLLILTLLAPMTLSAKLSDDIKTIQALYATRAQLIKEKTENEPDSIKEIIKMKNLKRAQEAELYEEELVKQQNKCLFGRLCSWGPSKPTEYDLNIHCWDSLKDVRYEELDKKPSA